MTIITLSGLDGSGKSTQAKRIKEYLEKNNGKVYYFHAPSYSLANKILGHFKGNKKTPYSNTSVTSSTKLGVFLRRLFLLIDAFRFRVLLRRLEKKTYTHVLSDRYFYDTQVHIAYLDKSFNLKKLRLIPKPNCSFFLDIEPSVIMKRKRKPEQGLEYLENKAILYKKIIHLYQLHVIVADASPDNVTNKILKLI